MKTNNMKRIWTVSMEYAGICEAGGVKNVACSLSESFAMLGNEVTVFLPFWGCVDTKKISGLKKNSFACQVEIAGKTESVSYKTGFVENYDLQVAVKHNSTHNNNAEKKGKIRVVFAVHKSFAEKNSVYTYTAEDEKANPAHKKGTGFADAKFIETLFSKSVAAFAEKLFAEQADGGKQNFALPDIIHCHDAATALVPQFFVQATKNYDAAQKTKCAVTIHNAGPAYHHEFASVAEAKVYTGLPTEILERAKNGSRVEPFLLAAECGAVLNTVSEEYAKEISDTKFDEATDGLAKCFADKGVKIFGITNGIDYERYVPSDTAESLLPFAYNPETGDLAGKSKCTDFFIKNFAAPNAQAVDDFLHEKYFDGIKKYGALEKIKSDVLFCYHGRIVSQKGIDVLLAAAKIVLPKNKHAKFVITGQGEARLENELVALTEEFAGRAVYFGGYNKNLARLCIAACDYIVLPSHFEPCGLEDLIAQIYGTIPVAHATGGLKKIIDGFGGFLYQKNDAQTLAEKINELTEFEHKERKKFNKIISVAANYVKENYNWQIIAEKKYMPLFLGAS